MRVRILAVGTRMPEWVTTAYEDYTRRMRKDMRVDLEDRARRQVAGWKKRNACSSASATTTWSRSTSTANP